MNGLVGSKTNQNRKAFLFYKRRFIIQKRLMTRLICIKIINKLLKKNNKILK
jgi:hypothetical protein